MDAVSNATMKTPNRLRMRRNGRTGNILYWNRMLWHGRMSDQLPGELDVERYASTYTENFTKDMPSEYTISNA